MSVNSDDEPQQLQQQPSTTTSKTDSEQLDSNNRSLNRHSATSPNASTSSATFNGFNASNLLERIAQQLNTKYSANSNSTPSNTNSIRDLLASSASSGGSGSTTIQQLTATVQSMLSDGSDSSSASPAQLEIANDDQTHVAAARNSSSSTTWLSLFPQSAAAAAEQQQASKNQASSKMPGELASFIKEQEEKPDDSSNTTNGPTSIKSSPRAVPDESNKMQSLIASNGGMHHQLSSAALEEIDAFARPGPNYQVVDTSKLPPVYSFFTRTFVANTGEIKAYCGSCRKHIASHKGDVTRTSNLIRHLKNMHPELHQEFQSTRSRYCRRKEAASGQQERETAADGSPERLRARKTTRLDSTNSATSCSTPSSSSLHDVNTGNNSCSQSATTTTTDNKRKLSQLFNRQHSTASQHHMSDQSTVSTSAAAFVDQLNMLSMAPPSLSAFHSPHDSNSLLTATAGGGVGSSTSSSSLPHSPPTNHSGTAALLLAAGGLGGTRAHANNSNGGSSDVDVMLLDEQDDAAGADEEQRQKRSADIEAVGRNAATLAALNKQNSNTNSNAVHTALASMLALSNAQQQQLNLSTSPAAAAGGGFGDRNGNNNFAQRSAHLMHALGLAARNGQATNAAALSTSPPFSSSGGGGGLPQNMPPNGINSHNINSFSPNHMMNGQQNGGLAPNALLNLARNVFSNTSTFNAGTLIGVPALINPQLLYILAKMGAGDELLFVPQNFAASSYAARNKIDLVFLNGLSLFTILEAVLRIFPIDVENGAPVMLPQAAQQNAGMVTTLAPVLQAAVMRNYSPSDYPRHQPVFNFAPTREHMLSVAKENACAVVQTGERSDFMFMLLRKGSIIAADKAT